MYKNTKLFPQVFALFQISTSNVWENSVLPHPCQHSVWSGVFIKPFWWAIVFPGTQSEVPGSTSHMFNLHFPIDYWCGKLFHMFIGESHITLSEVQGFCPLFIEHCLFLLGYRSPRACHTLKRDFQIIFRTFDQNEYILAHSIPLMTHYIHYLYPTSYS